MRMRCSSTAVTLTARRRTGLFLSALDRATLAPLTNRPPAPAGIREGDRAGAKGGPLTGANPQHDENFLRVLYTLNDLSRQPKYRDAADNELKWFLQNAACRCLTDQPIAANGEDGPASSSARGCCGIVVSSLRRRRAAQFALSLWEHQIANHQTGAFNRHAGYWKHEAIDGMDFPRHAGFYIRTWASAYSHTNDPAFLRAIEVLLARFEQKRHPQTGLIELRQGQSDCAPALALSLAIDCEAAADRVPEPLANRLRAFAAREDEVFCGLPHPLGKEGGFLTTLEKVTGKPAPACTPLWDARYGGFTTAQLAMMCVARYDHTGKVAYRNLITNAANAYLSSKPPPEVDLWPMTLGHAISLQTAAWRHTAKQEYLQRAREFASLAVEVFWKIVHSRQPAPSVSNTRASPVRTLWRCRWWNCTCKSWPSRRSPARLTLLIASD